MKSAPYPTREDQAKAEIGITAILRRSAIIITILFLITIISVLLIDQAAGGWRNWRILAARDGLQTRLHSFETALEEDSSVARAIRPVIRSALTVAGALGTEKVYLGRQNWLFYEPDVRHVTSQGFLNPIDETANASRLRQPPSPRRADPIGGILDFKAQLAARGIQLVIVPTPVKPTIHPEMLWARAAAPIGNASFAKFKQELESKGVLVFDTTGLLATAARNAPQYLAQDTHWRPEAMELAAGELANFVNGNVQLPQSLGMEYARGETQIRAAGDLAAMLDRDNPSTSESVTIHPVRQPDGKAWSPQGSAEILWLGDSFSNIYSAEPMGFGAAAGFAEQFSFRISRPLDALRRNDNGAFATRQMLADEMAQGRDRLTGKKLVIWQFAARELSQGDWKPIELKLMQRANSQFIVPPIGESWMIQGTVAAQGTAPRPGNVAYRDHILAVHLASVTVDSKPSANAQAIVYLRSMTNGKLTPAATLQIGQQIKVKIRDWSEVSRLYEFINRSDLPDQNLRSQPACWGELLQ